MSWGGLEEDSPASPRLDRLSLRSESESLLGQEDTARSVVVSLLAATSQQDKQVRGSGEREILLTEIYFR